MILTATTILFLFLIGVIAVGLGHYTDRQELYFLGVVLMLFMGLFMIQNGVAQQVGESVTYNATVVGNETVTDQTTTFVYDQETGVWTNGLGLLLVLVAAGLSLTWWNNRKREKEQKLQGIDLE